MGFSPYPYSALWWAERGGCRKAVRAGPGAALEGAVRDDAGGRGAAQREARRSASTGLAFF